MSNKIATEIILADSQKTALEFSVDGDQFISAMKQVLRIPPKFTLHDGGKPKTVEPPIYFKANAGGLEFQTFCDGFKIRLVAQMNVKLISQGDVVIPRKAAEKLLGLNSLDRFHFKIQHNMLLISVADKVVLSLVTFTEGTRGYEIYHRRNLFDELVIETRFEIQSGMLKNLLDKTTYAASTDKFANDNFKAVYFQAQENKLIISAVDGYQIARANATLPENFTQVSSTEFSISPDAANFLRKSLSNNEDAPCVSITVDGANVHFDFNGLTIMTPNLNRLRPPIEQKIPQDDDILFTIFFNTREVFSFLKAAQAICKNVILEFNNGLEIKTANIFREIQTWHDVESNANFKKFVDAISRSEFKFARVATSIKYLANALSTQGDDGVIELSKNLIRVRSDNSIAVFAPAQFKIDGEIKIIELSNSPLKETDCDAFNRDALKQIAWSRLQKEKARVPIIAEPIRTLTGVT